MAVDQISRPRAVQEVKGRSLWADARHRFLRNKAAVDQPGHLHHHRVRLLRRAAISVCGRRTISTGRLRSWAPAGPRHRLPASAPTATAATCSCACCMAASVSLLVGFTATIVSLDHRRGLGRDRRLHRRPGRRRHDAHRRHPLFAALHLLRDHADGGIRPQHHADLYRDRRSELAGHGPHRARPDHLDPPARSSSRRRRPAASRSGASSRATSSRTAWARSWST